MHRYIAPILAIILTSLNAIADSIPQMQESLDEIVVTQRQKGVRKLGRTATNSDLISAVELRRAACCNLGESFSTNASVDVNYSDAATGARQIKLLGLSGTYVQMLSENIPNLRGAASLYGLGYIPGPWMQSIQVSKGASSVKNGYESITGQINIEFLKPQSDPSVSVNGYADIFGKAEVNAAGNIHLNNELSTGLLFHAENAFASHDENNDGFADLPKIRQITGLNRWAYMGDNYIFQAWVRFLAEKRLSGQHSHSSPLSDPYKIDINTSRWELYTKNAYIIDRQNNSNVALILSGSIHKEDAAYGLKNYNVTQDNLYASLMFERQWSDGLHEISTGLSLNYDRYNQFYRLFNNPDMAPSTLYKSETTPGAYVQYTFNLNSTLILMGGIRFDHSSVYKSMLTPRIHLKWNILNDALTIYGSAGRGYRSPQPLAENHFYMASSRRIIFENNPCQEIANNYGGGISGDIDIFRKTLTYNAEFYYTNFRQQLLIDLDSDPHAVIFSNSGNRANYSHTFQLEASYPIINDFTLTAAYRFTNVKVDYGNGPVTRPLTSRHKGLFSINWLPNMGIWQVDLTLAINGGGRMPTPYSTPDGTLSWAPTYKTFTQLNAQVTRNFRHWAIYIGGENLTGFKQKMPIIDAANPWGNNFDATMVYGTIHGPMAYIGFRYNFTKY